MVVVAATAVVAPRLEPCGRIEALVVAQAALAAPREAPHGRIEALVVAPVVAADAGNQVYYNTSTTAGPMDATPIMIVRTVLSRPPTSAIHEWPVTRTTRRMQHSTI